MSSEVSFKGVFDLFVDNFKWIAIICIVGTLAGVFYSLSIAPRFKSTAKVFPINLEPFSDESETEQMMQMFEFTEIRDSVIQKFELWTRDGLNPEDPEYHHWVNRTYQERVSISPTRYESVEISCQDEDPVTAKLMVEEVIYQFNENNRRIKRRMHQEYYDMKQREMTRFSNIIDSLENRQAQLRDGTLILDMDAQSESLTEGYLRLLEKGSNRSKLDEVRSLMRAAGEKGGEIKMLNSMIDGLGEYYALLMEDYNKEASKKDDQLSYAQVVVEPQVSDKKSYPVRWLIVMASAIASLFSAMVFFAIRQRIVSA